ncbi:MAG: phosphatidylglycerol lysyltransferase domain-containing protein [Dysgonamonadaceae bacterium]|jgi:hypothetical protein|nr:phosphatidylglycerol lysyltransferase domain-containing protein [Dysgonamonadaceae bacterium]
MAASKLDFQPVMLSDRDTLQSFFANAPFRNCDFSFANIFCWKHVYNTTFAVENHTLYIRFQVEEGTPGYLFPLGWENLQQALQRVAADAEARNMPVKLYAVTREMFNLIEETAPGIYSYHPNRAWSEYIYRADSLISLAGKKLQAKRNHVNRFSRTYKWEYMPITRKIIPDCLKLYRRWCAENGGCDTDESLVEECKATHSAFQNFEQLHLTGGAISINGEVIAYSYGQPLGKDTFGIHAEKSLYEIEGGFSMINRQFAEHNCKQYTYINREEDLGLESLRKAKLSYLPEILLEKGTVQQTPKA